MLRVAYLGMLPLPAGIATNGFTKVSETLLREYERADVSVHVEAVTLSWDFKNEYSYSRGNVTYHYLPCKAHGKTLTFCLQEIAQLRKRVQALAADVVHGQPWPEYMLAAVSCGRPHVITIHSLPWREGSTAPVRQVDKWVLALVRELLHRRAIRRSENIISISSYVDDYLRGWARGRVWQIPNPIDEEFFELKRPVQSGLRIICLGTVGERKNQKLLVEACARMAERGVEFECRIIGPLLPESRIDRLVAQWQLQGRVTITGAISAGAVLDHYRWANIVVLPSRGETSPLSLIQAMACGRCVFGAAAAGIPSLFRNEKFGTLFSPNAPDELCDKLLDFRQRPDAYWKKAAAAEHYARRRFWPGVVAEKTLDLYKQIATNGSASRRSDRLRI